MFAIYYAIYISITGKISEDFKNNWHVSIYILWHQQNVQLTLKWTISLISMILFYTLEYNQTKTGPSWSWSYGSWIYNYLCNQCLSPLMFWVRISIRARCTTTLCDKFCQWLATGQWCSPGSPVSSTNIIDRNDIAEILLKVGLNTITLTITHMSLCRK